jgi:hypothetical protein
MTIPSDPQAAAARDDATAVAEVVCSRVWPKVTNWPSTGSAPETFLYWAVAELVKAGYAVTPPKDADLSVRELTGPLARHPADAATNGGE